MFRSGRYKYLLRRAGDVVVSVANGTSFVVATVCGRTDHVWLGDSHAGHFAGRFSTANVLRASPGVYVLHLGARLMYSTARDGFPAWSVRLLGVARTLGRRPRALIVCTGEIDIRCHLAGHSPDGRVDTSFVTDYVARALELADRSGAAQLAFVVPPPPCRDQPNLRMFPVVGSFHERTAAFDALRRRLVAEVESQGRGSAVPVTVVDATDELWDAQVGIGLDLSDDRCHTNEAGSRIVRRLVSERVTGAA